MTPLSPIVKRIAGKSTTSSKEKTTFSFSSPSEVFLGDWWLSKPKNGNGAAVSGLPIEMRRCAKARKVFHSVPAKQRYATRVYDSKQIVKRHDCTTLETADGCMVSLCGFINRSLTLENEFSSKVCRDFIYGFPSNWETAIQGEAEESSGCIDESFSTCLLPTALGTYNGAQLHDLVLSLNDTERVVLNKKLSDDLMGILNPYLVIGKDEKHPKCSPAPVFWKRHKVQEFYSRSSSCPAPVDEVVTHKYATRLARNRNLAKL